MDIPVTTVIPDMTREIEHTMTTNSYDQLPYPNRSHKSAQVRKLEAIATLFGMQPREVSHCRVLELGAAAGGNLIPQAIAYPDSHFVGVELSARQVSEAQAIIEELELDNIEFRQVDILDIDSSWGEFDYILCHGVYSWVAENVRTKILAICNENLAASGVAHVSYNVLPGWHFRGTIRDMMLYHTSQFEQPAERLSQARAVLDFMADNCPADSAYGQMLRDELDLVRSVDDQYLFHDHLEDNNKAIYFHEFVQQAEDQGLDYLADTKVSSMLPASHSESAQNALANAPLVKQEQYMDFLRNNAFRSSLLCHQGISLNRATRPATLRNFQVSLVSKPKPFNVCLTSAEAITVQIGPGKINTNSPQAKMLLEVLSQTWPRSITMDELCVTANKRLVSHGLSMTTDDVAVALMDVFAVGLLDYFVHPPVITNEVSRQPTATRLARWQAISGNAVTNQRNEMINLNEFSRFLVARLDSQHDHEMLTDAVQAAVASGELTLQTDLPKRLDGLVESALAAICNASLLLA